MDIRGDYAYVKYQDTGVVSEVAIALLPFGVDVGDKLKFENFEFTTIWLGRIYKYLMFHSCTIHNPLVYYGHVRWIEQQSTRKGGQLMKKNVCYYMMMAASAFGHELTTVEHKMLAEFLRK